MQCECLFNRTIWNQTSPLDTTELEWYGIVIIGTVHQNNYYTITIVMATPVNWTREETFKLISLWSEDVIQEQLEGCCRNSLVYCKIADDLCEAGYSRSLEQCRDKIKKLKGEYKKIHDQRETTGEGQWIFQCSRQRLWSQAFNGAP